VNESLSSSSINAVNNEDTNHILGHDKAMHLNMKRTRLYMGHPKAGR